LISNLIVPLSKLIIMSPRRTRKEVKVMRTIPVKNSKGKVVGTRIVPGKSRVVNPKLRGGVHRKGPSRSKNVPDKLNRDYGGSGAQVRLRPGERVEAALKRLRRKKRDARQ